jgi:hypothetical protein
MSCGVSRGRTWIAWGLSVVVFQSLAAPAWAQAVDQQAAPSLAAVKAQVPLAEIVYVTDAAGTTINGKLIGITDDAIAIRVNQAAKSIPR